MKLEKEKAEAYVRSECPELPCIEESTLGKEIELFCPEIKLNHWLMVLGNLGVPVESYVLDGGLFETEVNYEQKVYFNLTTGQPATEADYQSFNQIVGI